MAVVSLHLDTSMKECDDISCREWCVFLYKTVAVLGKYCGLYLLEHFDMGYPGKCGGESLKDVDVDSVLECLEKYKLQVMQAKYRSVFWMKNLCTLHGVTAAVKQFS